MFFGQKISETLDLDLDPGRGGGMASSNPWPRKAAGLAGITVGLLGCAAGGYVRGGWRPARPRPEDDDLEVLEGFGQWPSKRCCLKEGRPEGGDSRVGQGPRGTRTVRGPDVD